MMKHWLASVFIVVLLIAVVAVSGCNKAVSVTDGSGKTSFKKGLFGKAKSKVPDSPGLFLGSHDSNWPASRLTSLGDLGDAVLPLYSPSKNEMFSRTIFDPDVFDQYVHEISISECEFQLYTGNSTSDPMFLFDSIERTTLEKSTFSMGYSLPDEVYNRPVMLGGGTRYNPTGGFVRPYAGNLDIVPRKVTKDGGEITVFNIKLHGVVPGEYTLITSVSGYFVRFVP